MPASVSFGRSPACEHAGLGNLAELAVVLVPPPMTDHEDGDVVSRKARKIAKDSMKLRRLGEVHADLFFKLSLKRRLDRLVPFDAAAREEPAWPIAVTHEKHAVLAVDHHPLRAERKPSPHPPERTQHFGKAAHRRRGRFLRRLQPCLLAPKVRGLWLARGRVAIRAWRCRRCLQLSRVGRKRSLSHGRRTEGQGRTRLAINAAPQRMLNSLMAGLSRSHDFP